MKMKITRRSALWAGLTAIAAVGGYFGYRKITTLAPNLANLPYGADARQLMDIYLPAGAGPHPFVLEIHGGAFKLGDKTAMPVQREILAAGIAIVRINYRFSSTAIWPAQGQDCLDAVAYLRAKGADYGLDSARMALWGQSAGGFLAVSTAISLAESGAPAQGVVDFYGPMDFSTMDADMTALGMTAAMGQTSVADSPESQLIGFNVADDPARARAIGPIGRLEGRQLPLPPAFIRHGDADNFIAHTQSQRLAEAWAKASPDAAVDFALVPGAGHGTSEFNANGVVDPLVAYLQTALSV
jgi:acetyl esterase/lipase